MKGKGRKWNWAEREAELCNVKEAFSKPLGMLQSWVGSSELSGVEGKGLSL